MRNANIYTSEDRGINYISIRYRARDVKNFMLAMHHGNGRAVEIHFSYICIWFVHKLQCYIVIIHYKRKQMKSK